MKIRLYLGCMILMLAAAGVILFGHREALPGNVFYMLEAALCIIILLIVIFYMGIFRSMRTIMSGMDLLREQDFSSRLAHVGQVDADKVVDMFNSMIAKLKEERLHVREQSHLMDLLIEKSPMGVIMLNGMDTIASANPAALQYLSATADIIGKKPSALSGPLAEVLVGLKNDECVTSTLSDSMIYRCSRLTFMDKGYKHPFFIIEPMTREVREAQKESYGKVIRVISHEVNNSMTAVGSMLSTLSDSHTYALDRELIDVCMQRCSSLSSFITGYANVIKIPQAQMRRVSVAEFVSSSRVLLESMCMERGYALAVACSEDFHADIDTVLMEQALINIVKNAVESLDCASVQDKDGCGGVRILVDGAQRTLTVEDDGPGITDEVAANLFKPFYSTKVNGQGIGLIFIAEVLTRNRCMFSLRTWADGITRFVITFPASHAH